MTGTFIGGVVEGFYGIPWTGDERGTLFEWMARWGLSTYVYAPKDDLHHRMLWREAYPPATLEPLASVVQAASARGVRFVYAIGPGLDIRYSSPADLERLQARAAQMLACGCHDLALLFDDVPGRLAEEDARRWPALAPAQCHVVNAFAGWLRERRPEARLLFCPTAYCSRMTEAGVGGSGYLETIGRDLRADIEVLWTGPEIVSREISIAHAREVGRVLRRKPVIWDNLHANDYDGRRFFCGPYAGRPAGLVDEVGGILSNPNCELPLNYVPLRMLARYLHGPTWPDLRGAWLEAIAEWHPRFATVHGALPFEDLVAFADCYYLPHENGPAGRRLIEGAAAIFGVPPARWGADADTLQQDIRRLRAFCEALPGLGERPLFHALARRVWELREELDLADRFIDVRRRSGSAPEPVWSDAHQPGTYRGGFVATLQRLLEQRHDGGFQPAANLAPRQEGA